MKIRTDFVTNSSSSSFVTYRLTNSEFCKYLHEQAKKNGACLDVDKWQHQLCTQITLAANRLYANFPCYGLYCDNTAPEAEGDEYDYTEEEQMKDVIEMSKRFWGYIEEYADFSKIDDPEKLYDAFLDDLKNDRFECDVYMGQTD